MATNLNVTELDFDQIKKNLKNYLKTQTAFSSHDFEGSGLSSLLDVLAYNTHYNAMAAHFALNEAFLDSAQIRGNIVTRAKLLGYIPRSVLAPRATITITVDVSGESGTIPSTLTLPRGTKLTTNVDGRNYRYVVLNEQSAVLSGTTFTFSNVTIVEGTRKKLLYRVDNHIENQKYQISDDDADTSTLRVLIQANELSTSFDNYTKFESLINVNSSSRVFYLQENSNEYYEVYFGDGVTGKKPLNNNIVTLDYIFTNGGDSNGANVFTMVDNIGGYATNTVTTLAKADGGTERETSESIRFNAPLTFTSQNRAVTSDDYRAIIQKEFTNINSISTWGGEDNDPPDYGSIYIAIKPLVNETLTVNEKTEITNTILKGKSVVSITPVIVDPNFTYLELDVGFKYNPNLTDRSAVELTSVVRDTVTDYNFNELNKFDGVFRHSQILKAIDNADPSIQNSSVRPYMFMTITPRKASDTLDNNFSLQFTAPFFSSGASTNFIISSTLWKLNGDEVYFGDIPISGTTNRQVIAYKVVDGVNVTVINNAGLINTTAGTITLNNFKPDDDSANTIRITVVPNSLDLAPKRDQLIAIDPLRVIITPSVDTISVSGSSGTIDYTTTSRLR
jgi:hypothetical protein|tara:strand:+ start:703 stop:2562 length:1860 start_codon:yes stop_codon:yes gene_type:complete